MRQVSRTSGRRRLVVGLIALLVFGAVFAAFRPALSGGFVDWDDLDNFLKNPNYRGLGVEKLRWMFTTFHMGHYQPLSWVTLGADFLWGRAVFGDGLDPRSYHLTNVLLHAANAVLAFWLAVRLFEAASAASGMVSSKSGEKSGWVIFAAALAALWFGVHPLRVESVAWVTERRDVLSSFFLLAGVLSYLRAAMATGLAANRDLVGHGVKTSKSRRHSHSTPPLRDEALIARSSRFTRPQWLWLALALVAYAASLLSRAMGVTLPVVLLLLDWYPLRRLGEASAKADDRGDRAGQARWSGILLEKVPFVLLAIGAAISAPMAQRAAGATASLSYHGPGQRLAQAAYGLVFYLRKLILPVDLSPIYEMRLPLDITSPQYAIPMLLVLVAVATLAILLIRRRLPAVILAGACYAILLLPVLGFVQSGNQEVADRYSYLPSVVITMLAAAGFWRACERAQTPRWLKGVLSAAGLVAVAWLGALTTRQCGVWHDTASLWTHAAAVSPNSSIAQNGYGWVLRQQKRYDEALAHFHRAVELQPPNEKAHNNIWAVLQEQGKADELIRAYQDSIRVYPGFVEAHYNLGVALQRRGEATAAEAFYRRALDLRPTHSDAHANLALLLVKRGAIAEAQDHFEQAIRFDGRNVVAHCGLARLLREQGRLAEAAEQAKAALGVDPNYEPAKRLLAELAGGGGE